MCDHIILEYVFRNLPEVRSAYDILGVPTVSARFGTSPFFWNWGMQAIVNFVPFVSSSIFEHAMTFIVL